MIEYFDRLLYQTQQVMVHKNFITTLRKTYSLPDCLPPLGRLPTKLEALEELNKQYPNDVNVLQNLVIHLKESKN